MMNETGSAGEANARPWHLGRAPADVRHLGLCAICGGIADQRTSISYEAARGYKASDPNAMWHPKCTFDEFGEAFVLDLPESEQAKFCLGDIPAETMRKILDGI